MDREPRRQLAAAELAEVDGGVSGATGLHHKGAYLPTEIRAPIYKDMAETNPTGFAIAFRGDPAAKDAYRSADIRTSYGAPISASEKRAVWKDAQDPVLHNVRQGWDRTPIDRTP
jgi:hypothetical protein